MLECVKENTSSVLDWAQWQCTVGSRAPFAGLGPAGKVTKEQHGGSLCDRLIVVRGEKRSALEILAEAGRRGGKSGEECVPWRTQGKEKEPHNLCSLSGCTLLKGWCGPPHRNCRATRKKCVTITVRERLDLRVGWRGWTLKSAYGSASLAAVQRGFGNCIFCHQYLC